MLKLRPGISIILLLCIYSGFAQDPEYPFASDIRKFIENDRIDPPPLDAILFVGSSSFTLWKDVQDYFPGYPIINRGFGGSTLPDLNHYADQIILPYHPKQIVIYCGENDIASSDTMTADIVALRFISLFTLIRSRLPDVRITYISMKPSPSRWHLADTFILANQMIREYLGSQTNTAFVNIWDKMLKVDHLPDSSLYLEDMLHMNPKGYRIWQASIQPELIH
ncbi:MAG TPA: GDSL-type esterase/lipase family protein [Bacteroidales bacterium]|nr:GDSL-type esterase/lipase family protein [Bacteroidales bacterium]